MASLKRGRQEEGPVGPEPKRPRWETPQGNFIAACSAMLNSVGMLQEAPPGGEDGARLEVYRRMVQQRLHALVEASAAVPPPYPPLQAHTLTAAGESLQRLNEPFRRLPCHVVLGDPLGAIKAISITTWLAHHLAYLESSGDAVNVFFHLLVAKFQCFQLDSTWRHLLQRLVAIVHRDAPISDIYYTWWERFWREKAAAPLGAQEWSEVVASTAARRCIIATSDDPEMKPITFDKIYGRFGPLEGVRIVQKDTAAGYCVAAIQYFMAAHALQASRVINGPVPHLTPPVTIKCVEVTTAQLEIPSPVVVFFRRKSCFHYDPATDVLRGRREVLHAVANYVRGIGEGALELDTQHLTYNNHPLLDSRALEPQPLEQGPRPLVKPEGIPCEDKHCLRLTNVAFEATAQDVIDFLEADCLTVDDVMFKVGPKGRHSGTCHIITPSQKVAYECRSAKAGCPIRGRPCKVYPLTWAQLEEEHARVVSTPLAVTAHQEPPRDQLCQEIVINFQTVELARRVVFAFQADMLSQFTINVHFGVPPVVKNNRSWWLLENDLHDAFQERLNEKHQQQRFEATLRRNQAMNPGFGGF